MAIYKTGHNFHAHITTCLYKCCKIMLKRLQVHSSLYTHCIVVLQKFKIQTTK